ncbi:MAG: LysR family transcriptional regulator [Bacteriovoracales bacterium]|nr:LysR family transcriptional regulator [Bacteriovoracales bacterium]
MLIDKINLNHLRIFECVYKNRSMTKAANELFLTQSGISQHIKHLEEVLQVRLFDRFKHRLIPTDDGKQLYLKSLEALLGIENALLELNSQKDRLQGTVSIGLPIDFGNNIILPLLGKFGKAHPDVDFSIFYGFGSDMEERLLAGDLDMAIVDDFPLDPTIKRAHIYDEELHLCSQNLPPFMSTSDMENIKKKSLKKHFEDLNYIKYKKDESMLNSWFKHHYGFSSMRLKIRAVLMNIEGVAKLITEGLGVGILSHHMIHKIRSRGLALHIFPGQKKALINEISIAYLERNGLSLAAVHLLSFLRDKCFLLPSPSRDQTLSPSRPTPRVPKKDSENRPPLA